MNFTVIAISPLHQAKEPYYLMHIAEKESLSKGILPVILSQKNYDIVHPFTRYSCTLSTISYRNKKLVKCGEFKEIGPAVDKYNKIHYQALVTGVVSVSMGLYVLDQDVLFCTSLVPSDCGMFKVGDRVEMYNVTTRDGVCGYACIIVACCYSFIKKSSSGAINPIHPLVQAWNVDYVISLFVLFSSMKKGFKKLSIEHLVPWFDTRVESLKRNVVEEFIDHVLLGECKGCEKMGIDSLSAVTVSQLSENVGDVMLVGMLKPLYDGWYLCDDYSKVLVLSSEYQSEWNNQVIGMTKFIRHSRNCIEITEKCIEILVQKERRNNNIKSREYVAIVRNCIFSRKIDDKFIVPGRIELDVMSSVPLKKLILTCLEREYMSGCVVGRVVAVNDIQLLWWMDDDGTPVQDPSKGTIGLATLDHHLDIVTEYDAILIHKLREWFRNRPVATHVHQIEKSMSIPLLVAISHPITLNPPTVTCQLRDVYLPFNSLCVNIIPNDYIYFLQSNKPLLFTDVLFTSPNTITCSSISILEYSASEYCPLDSIIKKRLNVDVTLPEFSHQLSFISQITSKYISISGWTVKIYPIQFTLAHGINCMANVLFQDGTGEVRLRIYNWDILLFLLTISLPRNVTGMIGERITKLLLSLSCVTWLYTPGNTKVTVDRLLEPKTCLQECLDCCVSYCLKLPKLLDVRGEYKGPGKRSMVGVRINGAEILVCKNGIGDIVVNSISPHAANIRQYLD